MEQNNEESLQNAAQTAAERDARVDEILAETAAAKQEAAKAAEQAAGQKYDNEGYNPRQLLFDAADLFESVLTSIFVVMLCFAFLFCTANVDGPSMLPTLEDGDRLVVSRLDKHYEDGDILIIYSDQAYLYNDAGELYAAPGLDKRIVKRLIATGGQTIDINFEAGIVTVDGEELYEPYINMLTKRDNFAFKYPLTVPEGYVFVMGDNRYVSMDSRHPSVGLVPEDDIVGKVIWRIAPFSKFGKIKPVSDTAPIE